MSIRSTSARWHNSCGPFRHLNHEPAPPPSSRSSLGRGVLHPYPVGDHFDERLVQRPLSNHGGILSSLSDQVSPSCPNPRTTAAGPTHSGLVEMALRAETATVQKYSLAACYFSATSDRGT